MVWFLVEIVTVCLSLVRHTCVPCLNHTTKQYTCGVQWHILLHGGFWSPRGRGDFAVEAHSQNMQLEIAEHCTWQMERKRIRPLPDYFGIYCGFQTLWSCYKAAASATELCNNGWCKLYWQWCVVVHQPEPQTWPSAACCCVWVCCHGDIHQSTASCQHVI